MDVFLSVCNDVGCILNKSLSVSVVLKNAASGMWNKFDINFGPIKLIRHFFLLSEL